MIYNIQKEDGFNEVFDSQKTFRILMDCMSRPGKVNKLDEHPFVAAPEDLNPYVLSVLKTLGDNNVSLAVADADNTVWLKYLEINTNAETRQVEESDYVVFRGDQYNDSFSRLNPGSVEFPEESATAIISVKGLTGDTSDTCRNPDCFLSMSGPGIKDKNSIGTLGMERQYIDTFLEINAVFPIGIDIILVDTDGNVACIPRSAKVEVV